MEIDESPKPNIKCFKSNLQCLGPLNIDYNASSTTFILWNKYEIYVYNNLKFESASKILLPEFQIFNLISSNNFIACLDFAGNVHTTPMKFKQSVPKRFKTNEFLLREKCVLSFTLYTALTILSLKFECGTYYLCINNLNAEFELQKKTKLSFPHNIHQFQNELNTHMLKCYKLHEQYDNLMKVFNIDKDLSKDYYLILISFDRRILYGCVYSLKTHVNKIILQNLFSAPSRICDVKVTEADYGSILISLETGTLIRQSLVDLNKAIDIVHLNTIISKNIPFNESMIYTDGISMWKSNNTFKKDINFQQFLVKHVKDFIYFGDQILCTTYNNLIYLFNVDNEMSYIKSSSNEYCEARKVLNESGYAHKILEEIENNYKIEEKIKEESNYITVLSLSNRPDILNNVIHYSIILYDSYEDVLKESINVTLMDNVKKYFAANILCLLIKITLTFEKRKINDVLLEVLKDLQIHITLMSMKKVIKTTTVKVIDELKNINLLIPLNSKVADTTVAVNIKIVKRIPGMQHKDVLWTIIHQKEIILNAEHFIKFDMKNNILQLKEPGSSMEEIINEIAKNCNKHLFHFTDVENKRQSDEFSFYVKLPINFKEAFQNDNFYKKMFNAEKALNLLKENTSGDFMKAKNNLIFVIGNSKVKVEIINDEFTANSLRVTCENMKICFDMRNFYCNLAYDNFSKCEPGKEFIRYTLYATVENIQRGIRQCITDENADDLKNFLEQFQRYVFGAIPL